MSKNQRIPTLTDATEAADHLRAMIDSDQLSRRTVLVVGCDPRARPVAHWHLLDCAEDATPSDCSVVLGELVTRLELDSAIDGLVLGLTRPGGEEVQPYDRMWFRAYRRICHHRALRPYGAYLVTRAGARPVHIDDAA